MMMIIIIIIIIIQNKATCVFLTIIGVHEVQSRHPLCGEEKYIYVH
jgi:hypothetical protein